MGADVVERLRELYEEMRRTIVRGRPASMGSPNSHLAVNHDNELFAQWCQDMDECVAGLAFEINRLTRELGDARDALAKISMATLQQTAALGAICRDDLPFAPIGRKAEQP